HHLCSLRTNLPFSTPNHSLCLKLGQQNNTITLTQPFGKFVVTIINKTTDFFMYTKHDLAKFIAFLFVYFSMNRVMFALNLVIYVRKLINSTNIIFVPFYNLSTWIVSSYKCPYTWI